MSRLTTLSRSLCLGLLLFGAGSNVRAQEAKATSRGERLIHDYFGVNLDIVWEIVSKELAAVADSLERISEEGGS